MRTGFDLSPVIDLLDALSPSPSNPFLLDPSVVVATGVVKSLGDFSTLWQFLDDCRIDSSVANASVATISPRPKEPVPPPSSLPSPEKRRKRKKSTNVTFNDPTPNPGLSPAIDYTDYTDTTEEIPRATVPRTLIPASIPPPPSHGLAAPPMKILPPRRPVIRARPSASERKAQLIQMVVTLFPTDAPTLLHLNVKTLRPVNPLNSNIHIFIDNSNILIGFYELIKKLRGFPKDARTRAPLFSFHNLSLILERGRATAKKVLVGSSPITPVVHEAEALGYETSILEKVQKERVSKYQSSSSGSESSAAKKTRIAKVEQAVDEILHLKILESILDFAPSTIVLASGDAAAGEYSPGFFRVVERALERGWKVELASFKKSLSFQYDAREFKHKWRGSFRSVQLDQFAELLLDGDSA